MKQAELRKSANLQPGQDVFGDTGRIRLLMLPALVKESNSNGGNIDQDIVMDNDQKITKNTKNICLKDKKEKKQINNAGFW